MGNDYAVNANYQTWLWEKLGEKCVKLAGSQTYRF